MGRRRAGAAGGGILLRPGQFEEPDLAADGDRVGGHCAAVWPHGDAGARGPLRGRVAPRRLHGLLPAPRSTNTKLDAYFAWPGFFVVLAFLTRASGLDTPLHLLSVANWAP